MPLIVFEGQDGSSKGTQMARAVEYLSGICGRDQIVTTRDPGGTKFGELVRNLLFRDFRTQDMAPGVVDLLFLSSHLQNWKTVVEPALLRGQVVVCDRWWYSQEAYSSQRYVPTPIDQAYRKMHGPNADLLIMLYGNSRRLLDRTASRAELYQENKAWNDSEIMRRIQDKYFEFFRNSPEFAPVDAEGTVDEVWERVKLRLDNFLKQL